MSRISFHGSLETGDAAVVEALLRAWLGADGLAMRVKRPGPEVVFEENGFYLYCYEAGAGVAPAFYLLEGHQDGTLDAARERLTVLHRLCQQRGVECSLEWVQVGDAGDELSEQFTLN